MKNTGRKALSVLLALVLLASLLPMAALASEPSYAEVYTEQELKNALKDGGTIKLGDDINVNEALTVSKDTTLDLNGHKVAVNHNGMENYAVLVNAYLTVQDTSYGKNGKITSSTANTLFLDYGEGAKNNSLTLKSGTVENTCRKMGDTAIVAVGTNISTVTITGGTVRSDDGSAMFAQSAVAISGGFFQGEVYLSMPEYNGAEHQTITGGCFDRVPGGWYDFYGKKYEVTDNTDAATKDTYPYAVQEIPANKRVTVSYTFPEDSGLTKPDDYFRENSSIEMPDAPYYPGHRFIAWSVSDAAISFPYKLGNNNLAFAARFLQLSPAPDGFFPTGKPLTDLYVGGVSMMKNGVSAGDLPYKIKCDTGTATLAYNDDYGVYSLTLDTYVYSGPGYLWEQKEGEAADSDLYNCGIFAKGNLAIILDDDEKASEITVQADDNASGAVGIAVTGGSLAIGCVRNDLSWPGLTVQSVGRTESDISAGIYVDGDLAVMDCALTTIAKTGEEAVGIITLNNTEGKTADMYVSGSRVITRAGDAPYGAGVVATGNIRLESSYFKALAEGSVLSYGVTTGKLTLDNSTMNCTDLNEDACESSCGVHAEEIEIKNGAALWSEAGPAADESCGVEAGKILVDVGGELQGVGGDVTDGASYGVASWKTIIIGKNGFLFGLGGSVETGDSNGIDANVILVNNGGALRGFGGNVTNGDSYGVYADKITAAGPGITDVA